MILEQHKNFAGQLHSLSEENNLESLTQQILIHVTCALKDVKLNICLQDCKMESLTNVNLILQPCHSEIMGNSTPNMCWLMLTL